MCLSVQASPFRPIGSDLLKESKEVSGVARCRPAVLTEHHSIPLIARKELPQIPEPAFEVKFHVDVVLEYERRVVVAVGDLAQHFEVRVPTRNFCALDAGEGSQRVLRYKLMISLTGFPR